MTPGKKRHHRGMLPLTAMNSWEYKWQVALTAPLTSVSCCTELSSAGAASPTRAQGMAAVLVQSPGTAWGCSMAHSTHSPCASLPRGCNLHTAHEELAVKKTTPTLSPWWWGAPLEPSAGLSYHPPPAEQPWEPVQEPCAWTHPGPSGNPHATGKFAACRRQLHKLIGHLPDSSSHIAHSPLHNLGDMKLAMAGLGLLGSWCKCWWSFIIAVIYHYLHCNSALGPLLGLGCSCPGCGEYLAGDSQLGARCVLKLPWKSIVVHTKESLARWVLVFPSALTLPVLSTAPSETLQPFGRLRGVAGLLLFLINGGSWLWRTPSPPTRSKGSPETKETHHKFCQDPQAQSRASPAFGLQPPCVLACLKEGGGHRQ